MTSTTEPGPDAPSGAGPSKIPIDLTGVSETMLATLRARAEDAAKPAPFLGDTWAKTVLDQLDWHHPPTKSDYYFNAFVVGRGKLLDRWTCEFLAEHAADDGGVTVLHLACGLDSRALRIDDWRTRARWIDVDVPEVMALRRRVLPDLPEGGDYRMLQADVTSADWLEQIPADRPTLVIMEGLLMYLEWDDIVALLRRICDRFPSGQILADVLGRRFIARQSELEVISSTGAVMKTGIDSASELAAAHEKLRVREETGPWNRMGPGLFPWYLRLVMYILSWMPRFRSVNSDMRLDF
ncbi:S-adenosyl-L-methionine-dependent methyltransferase [Echria macrotheca]|uniref:S-adenosyl-L-methionine-dependent methyltransferase n=1 Tax=Echria macrotheca TaxID=438768 RepID=A0AAJ0F3V3_9PEZI|nr:S-adenosyl-L-methionine-dependent methyltransferase [Echria macrotheca]